MAEWIKEPGLSGNPSNDDCRVQGRTANTNPLGIHSNPDLYDPGYCN